MFYMNPSSVNTLDMKGKYSVGELGWFQQEAIPLKIRVGHLHCENTMEIKQTLI